MNDLFGKEFTLSPQEHRTLFAKRREPTPSGYIAKPGTGPAGETCGSCKHLFRNRMAKTYLKCGLYEPWWTGGKKTDVLARSPACSKWEVAP